MKVKFFAVPGLDPEAAEMEVNAFLAKHRIASIDRQLVNAAEAHRRSICFLESL